MFLATIKRMLCFVFPCSQAKICYWRSRETSSVVKAFCHGTSATWA